MLLMMASKRVQKILHVYAVIDFLCVTHFVFKSYEEGLFKGEQ